MSRTFKTVLFLLAGLACSYLMLWQVSQNSQLTWMDWYQELILTPTWNAWSLFLPILVTPALISFGKSVQSFGFGESLLKLLLLPLSVIPMTLLVTLLFAGCGNLILWIIESVQDGTIEDKLAIFFGTIGGIVLIALTPVREWIVVVFRLKD